MARYEVQGAVELGKKLRHLKSAAQSRVMRTAANFAMTPVLQAARANAPVGDRPHKTYKGRTVAPGFLKRNVKKRSRLSRDKSRAYASVTAAGEAWYGSLLEKGYLDVPARPWLRPAFNSNREQVKERFASKMRQRILIEARK